MHVSFGSIAVSLAMLAAPAVAQGQAGGSTNQVRAPRPAQGAMRFSGQPAYHRAPVTDAPYSAERISEHLQIGSDGTRFTSTTSKETIYRDSAGRTRTERSITGSFAPPGAPLTVEIQDPVAKVSYTLDAQGKIAHRVPLAEAPRLGPRTLINTSGQFSSVVTGSPMAAPAPPPPSGAALASAITVSGSIVPAFSNAAATASPGAVRPRPEPTTEDLGQRTIEGVLAQGQRVIETWPEGAVGNDRPFQVILETWSSPELHEMMLSKTSDPRTGENTTKLVNISRAEPPISLFSPPSDYTVVDETGPYEIRWTAAP